MKYFILASIILEVVFCGANKERNIFNDTICESLPEFTEELRQRIDGLSSDVNRIFDFVLSDAQRGITYKQLALFIDQFGSRLTGTNNLENAIDYMVDLFEKSGLDKVYTENVTVPIWNRGIEWAKMLSPKQYNLSILTLGGSVGTDGKVLTGEVVVVKDFDELERRSDQVKGKIVVFNFDYVYYGEQIIYRLYGASKAAEHGAIAALVKSVTPYSINTPHAGWMYYNMSDPLIPGVSITVEDAEMLGRITARGENVTLSLYLEARFPKTSGPSRNTISEVTGTQYPEQVVMISAHIDSWDVGQGAMDDGGGVFITWQAMTVLKKLGLKPKRTIRSILWTGEEFGLIGAQQYVERHAGELGNLSIAMESDFGTFTPTGLTYSGKNPMAQCVFNQVMKLMKPINATELNLIEEGSDTDKFMEIGVPGSMLESKNDHYFDFHHTSGDTMTVMDIHQLDLCTALWTAVAYALASLDDLLPR